MRLVAYLALALLLLSVEAVLERSLGLQLARIDVTLVLVVFLGLRAQTASGAFTAFCIGYLYDVLSGHPTGLGQFLCVLTFTLVRFVASLVDARARALFSVIAALASLGRGLLAAFFIGVTAIEGGAYAGSISGLPLQMLLTGLVAFALWPLLRRLDPGADRPRAGVLL